MSSTPPSHAKCSTTDVDTSPLGSTATGCFLARLVASSVRVSESAGELIKNIMNDGDLKVVDKNSVKGGPADLQTLADRSAQYMIVKSLQEKFHNRLTIIGEEDNTSRVEKLELDEAPDVLQRFEAASATGGEIASIGEQDVVIWVDPLDGTSEFVEAAKDKSPLLQQVTVLIGIAYHGRAIAGIVHQPYFDPKRELGRTIWGVKGFGVHGVGDSKQTLEANTDGQRIGVTTRSHSTEQNTATLDALMQAGLLTRVDRIGGAGYKVLKLLEGSAAYVHANAGTKKWDTAAPEAIRSALVEASGGKLTDISGRDLYYGKDAQLVNTGGILATAAGINHQDFADRIPSWVKEKLPEKAPPV